MKAFFFLLNPEFDIGIAVSWSLSALSSVDLGNHLRHGAGPSFLYVPTVALVPRSVPDPPPVFTVLTLESTV